MLCREIRTNNDQFKKDNENKINSYKTIHNNYLL